jgi:ABC-2 type transport system ATP-binding protein
MPSTYESKADLSGADTTSVATLQRVSKRYANGVMALGTAADGLSLSLRRGEIVALLGPNGAGKSTTVRLLMGLSAPSSGTVRIFGADPRQAATRLRTGVMLQVGRTPDMLRVREQLELFRGYYPAPMAYAELVKAAGLAGIEERFFGQLSGGQKQRVLFALALAGDPDLIFLDEPTVGLDIESRRQLWAQIRALAARGKTVLLTTHYLEEADALAHRIIVIDKGRVVCEGTPAEVKAFAAGGPSTNANAARPAAMLKTIRCVTVLAREASASMPGVAEVTVEAHVTTLRVAQPEATLREMLALDPTLHGLEVSSPALEDAFLALTSA